MSSGDRDFMLLARWIIPVIPAGVCHEDHAVVVEDGRISAILPQAEAIRSYPQLHRIDLKTHIVTPGLVNAHGHAAMTLLRGYSDDRELMDWLENHMWPAEARFVDQDFCYDGTELAIAEMIRTGTTCGADTYFFPDATAKAYADNHFRAQVCLPVIQFPNAWASSEEEHIDKALAVHDSLKDHELIRTAFAPHAPYTVSDKGFERVAELSDELKLPVHLHLHETATEVESAITELGQRPFSRMSDFGLINERLQTIHMTQLTDDEIEQLASRGAHVAHCPESNMKLASGFCRVKDLMAAGVNVAVGTDGAASNNNLDMLEEIRTAALVAKGTSADATVVNAHQALEMATINGAKLLGLENEIGSLEPGKAADIMAVDVSALSFQPMHHPISQLIYTATGHQVSDVWINGKYLLKDGVHTSMDTAAIREKVGRWYERMRA